VHNGLFVTTCGHCRSQRDKPFPEKSKLYKAFDGKIAGFIANAIVTRTAEYDEAQWG
jgi:hypothetical protein